MVCPTQYSIVGTVNRVVANARSTFKLTALQQISEVKTCDLTEHVHVYAAAIARIFQATLPLLQKAKKHIFMVVSSGVPTIRGVECVPVFVGSNGALKATMDLLVRCIHFKQPECIAFVVHPR